VFPWASHLSEAERSRTAGRKLRALSHVVRGEDHAADRGASGLAGVSYAARKRAVIALPWHTG
jgi:hypothetical protein